MKKTKLLMSVALGLLLVGCTNTPPTSSSNESSFSSSSNSIANAVLEDFTYSVTLDSIIVEKIEGAVYKLDNGEWQTNNVFTDLESDTTYQVSVKILATETLGASEVVTKSVTTAKQASSDGLEIKAKTSSTKIVVEAIEGAEYSLDGVDYQDANVFSSLVPGETYTIYLRIKANGNVYASSPITKSITLPLKDKLDIVILAGQSNALGISSMSEIGLNRAYDDIKIYCAGEDGQNTGNYNQWTTVKTGLGLSTSYFGPEIGMSEVLQNAYNDEEEYRNLAIVKYAWGGTAMWDWWLSSTSVAAGLGNTANINYQIDGKNVAWLYHNMINATRNALINFNNYDCNLLGMAWMQGETDATSRTMADNYQTILTNFINDVRNDLSSPNLPIYIGEISTRLAGFDDKIRGIQQTIADTIDNVDLIKTSDLEMGYLDWWHFTAKAQLELGRRFGSALLQHTGLEVESVDDLNVVGYLNNQLDEVLYATVNYVDGTKGYLPITIKDSYVLDSLGNKTIKGVVNNNGIEYEVNINVTIKNGAKIDGQLNDYIYNDATEYSVSMYQDIYAATPLAPTINSSAKFKIVQGDDGLFVGAQILDEQINNNFVNTNSFDWDLCLNNGIEIYLDASGQSSTVLTDKSCAIWLTSSDMLRYYDSNGLGAYDGINDYLDNNHKAKTIKREVGINGTPNQSDDVDASVTFEVFVPYSLLGETDVSKYRFAIGFRTLHWFTDGKFELPYGVYCNAGMNTFANGNPSSWKSLSELI